MPIFIYPYKKWGFVAWIKIKISTRFPVGFQCFGAVLDSKSADSKTETLSMPQIGKDI